MTEQTQNGYRQLDANPKSGNLDPSVTEKASAENTELAACAARLKDPKDASTYDKDLKTLQGAAENGWPLAQVELARHYLSLGAFHAASRWTDKLANNPYVTKSLESEITDLVPKKREEDPKPSKNDLRAMALYLETHQEQKDTDAYKEVQSNFKRLNASIMQFISYEQQKATSSQETNLATKDDNKPKPRRSSLRNTFAERADDENKSGIVKAYEQARLIKTQQERDEGYLPHHSYIPQKKED